MASRQERVESYRQFISGLQNVKSDVSAGEGKYTTLRIVTFALTFFTMAYSLFSGEISFLWTFLPGFFLL